MSSKALEALDRILNRGGEPDDVLRAAVSVQAEDPGIAWASSAFLDEGALALARRPASPTKRTGIAF